MTVAEFEERLPKESDTLYVLNFWATWCGPCVEELPYFVELDSVWSEKPVKFVLVSLDFAGQKDNSLLPFLQKRKINTEVWYLEDAHGRTSKGWIDRLAPEWSGSIPATLLLGAGHSLFAFREETFTSESLKAWLEPNIPE
ncbi:MAG: TlpA family protein disulfide reductase [Bacteroidia bacterium]